MRTDHSYCAHLHLPKTWTNVLCKALVMDFISVRTFWVRMRVITCDRDVVNMLHHTGPDQASSFDCRLASRKHYFTHYLTYITSNANQAQTPCISISVCFLAHHHCRLLPAVSTQISTLACGSHLHFFQCSSPQQVDVLWWQRELPLVSATVKVSAGLERWRPPQGNNEALFGDLRG